MNKRESKYKAKVFIKYRIDKRVYKPFNSLLKRTNTSYFEIYNSDHGSGFMDMLAFLWGRCGK